MFAYDEAPVSQPRTSLDIERFGRQALIRALNIGRVISFVGSGMSLKFGQPTWLDFRDRAAKLFFELENAIQSDDGQRDNELFKTKYRARMSPLACEIKELVQETNALEVHYFLELCEDYFAEAGELLQQYDFMQGDAHARLDPTAANERRKNLSQSLKEQRKQKGAAVEVEGHDPLLWAQQQFGSDISHDDGLTRLARSIEEFREDVAARFNSVDPKTRTDAAKLGLRQIPALTQQTDGLRLGKISNEIKAFDRSGKEVSPIDATRQLRTKLGVRRFLTLNYDLELERMLFEEGRATPVEPHDFFQRFIDQNGFENTSAEHYDQEAGRSVSLASPSGRIIRSTSSREETLADLFSFGAFPTNFDATVHHLHGRVDDPKNMIMTPKDYQRVYYSKSDQKKSFDEARHAVFTGSDIFVIGVGDTEYDVLEPLRDFLELEADRRDTYGKVYYVTSSSVTGEKSLKEAFSKTRRAAMGLAQKLYKQYGMHTLFTDHSFDMDRASGWTPASANLFATRAEVANYIKQISSMTDDSPGQGVVLWTDQSVEEEFREIFKSVIAVHDQHTPDQPFVSTPCPERLIARALAEEWKNAEAHAREKINRALRTVESRLFDRGLVEFVGLIEQRRKDWWRKWSTTPGMRLAILGPHRYERDLDDDNPDETAPLPPFKLKVNKDRGIALPIVWRQTNLAADLGDEPIKLGMADQTPQFTQVLKVTHDARQRILKKRKKDDGESDLENVASVARISIPPGGGKGRLISFFTSNQTLYADLDGQGRQAGFDIFPFQTLFAASLPDESAIEAEAKREIKRIAEQQRYIACYAVHLNFVLEFSSSMIAFARLLQNVIPELRREAEPDDPKWDRFLKHQFHSHAEVEPCIATLNEMYDFFKEVCPDKGWTTRIIMFLSYLDRLVDENGDAHSPVHRAFFRLVSGWSDPKGHAKLPIDTVLINCHADKPIRYLSQEIPLKKFEKNRRDGWPKGAWQPRKERKVALKNWTELKRVRPRVIFREALVHAAMLSFDQGDDPKKHAKTVFEWLKGRSEEYENDFLDLPPGLKSFMYRRVFNGHIFAGLAMAAYKKAMEESDEPRQLKAFDTQWNSAISALDIAYMREKTRGLLTELLSVYRRLDRINPDRDVLDPDPTEPLLPLSRRPTTHSVLLRERLRTLVVDHLALLNHLITIETLEVMPEIDETCRRYLATKPSETSAAELIKKELVSLVARGLASRYHKYAARASMTDGRTTPEVDYVYALDTKLASALRGRASLEVYSNYQLVAFQPSLYPSQPERALKPDFTHFNRVSQVVRALVKTSHEELLQHYRNMQGDAAETYDWIHEPSFANDMERYNDRLRSAYALVRGTFSISVVARMTEHLSHQDSRVPFDEYRTWTRKLLNTATLLGQIQAKYREMQRRMSDPAKRVEALPFNQPFLRDEISWLYNERALVSFVQGRLFDALPLFELSRTMLGTSTTKSGPTSHDATHRRVYVNHALAQLERGNIVAAQETLTRLRRETRPRWSGDTPSVVHSVSSGYLALCHHLTNEFTVAQELYEETLQGIRAFAHPRAESIFRRHYSDLLRTISKSRDDKDYVAAVSQVKSAEEIAMGIRAADLQSYALTSQARLKRDMHQRGDALRNLRQVEVFARRMGIQKMLAEVLKVRGEVLLAEGETTQAGFVTAQSIAISKRNGMRLRKISAAIIQAKILSRREQHRDAERLLLETITESQVLGYATKTSQALAVFEELNLS